uniref:Uncharacterized protein n=1 Tax=Anopheles coluzzii TaxID=1518534 RepID=A0A8W7P6W7_ANOCL
MVERVGRVIDDGSIVLLLLLVVLPTGVVVERGRLEARHLAGAGVPRRYIEPDVDEIVVVVQRTLAAQFPMVHNLLHSPEPGKRKSCRCSYQPSSVVPARTSTSACNSNLTCRSYRVSVCLSYY